MTCSGRFGRLNPPIELIRSDHLEALLTSSTMSASPTTSQSTRTVIACHRRANHVDDVPNEPRTTYESTHPTPPPYDIVEMITAHLIHDLDALKACSLTSSSWYTAAVPHLHHTLTFVGGGPDVDRSRLEPLSKLHELGLLPLVKAIRVEQWPAKGYWFVPQAFNPLTLHFFSTLTNVRALKLQHLEIHRFIRVLERYFGHFSQTLRSITLHQPCGTPQQLSYFLSRFPNLVYIGIQEAQTQIYNTIIPNAESIPPPAPRFRGRLVLSRTSSVEIWTRLIASCVSLQFRHNDLRWSEGCAPVLLEACAETLETLRFSNMSDRSLVGEGFRMGLSTDRS